MRMLIKLLGLGSPFGYDQLGWRAIKIFNQYYRIKFRTRILIHADSFDRPGIRLLKLMQGANLVFLIDAVVGNNTIGHIYRYEDQEINELKSLLSTHDVGLAQTLQLGRVLKCLPDKILFYGIEIGQNNYAQDNITALDPVIFKLLEQITIELCTLLQL